MWHDELATNDTPYTGPPPVSKDKVDYLQDFRWDNQDDPTDFPDSVQNLLKEGFTILWNREEYVHRVICLSS